MAEENIKRGETETQLIWDLIEEGDQKIKVELMEGVVLLIGDTGTGKSTLAKFICNPTCELTSVETYPDCNEFIITDKNQTSGQSYTIKSETLFPEFLIHPERRNVGFCDCPGFNDTRGGIYDIAATYFIKKVTELSKKVKLVFVVNYSSVRKGNDRLSFMKLIKHANKLIKSIEKCCDSIVLVVNKVDNFYKRSGNQTMELISDKSVISAIAMFLEEIKSAIKEDLTLKDNSDKQIHYESALKIIEALLEHDGSDFKKIGIFRRPDQPGKLRDLDLLKSNKKSIETIIFDSICYSDISKLAIGYSISPETSNYINELKYKIYIILEDEMKKISTCVIDDLQRIENQHPHKIYHLLKVFSSVKTLLKNVDREKCEYLDFIHRFTSEIKTLSGSIYKYNTDKIEKYKKRIDFLEEVDVQKTVNIFKGLFPIEQYVNNSEKWYSYLIELYEWLLKYQIQKIIETSDVDIIMITNDIQKLTTRKETHFKVNELLNLNTLLEYIKKQMNDIGFNSGILYDIAFHKVKLKSLKTVLDVTLKQHISEDIQPNEVIIKGNYIKLSDINKLLSSKIEISSKNRLHIKVYATNRLFIDQDINEIGSKLQLSFISPIWDINDEVKITLDGKPGKNFKDPARHGIHNGEKGEDGKPGNPGGPAGNFLGIAGKVMGGILHISANGGKGGCGQKGGDGAHGTKGENGIAVEPDQIKGYGSTYTNENGFGYKTVELPNGYNYLILRKNVYKYVGSGTKSTAGGHGGNGGKGGKGGPAGSIFFLDLNEQKCTPALLRSETNANQQDKYTGKESSEGTENKVGTIACVSNKVSLFSTIKTGMNKIMSMGNQIFNVEEGISCPRKNCLETTKLTDHIGNSMVPGEDDSFDSVQLTDHIGNSMVPREDDSLDSAQLTDHIGNSMVPGEDDSFDSVQLTDHIVYSMVPGEDGLDGCGGEGGQGYNHGKTTTCEITVTKFLFFSISQVKDNVQKIHNGRSRDGDPGKKGANIEHQKFPEKQEDFIDYTIIKSNFKAFIKQQDCVIDEPFLTKILDDQDTWLPNKEH